MHVRKIVSFLMITLLMLALIPKISASSFPELMLALPQEIPAELVEDDPAYGRIRPEYDRMTGKFTYFDFFVTATRAVTGIRYRTPFLWIKVEGYSKFYFDTTKLAEWQPEIYESAGQAVRVPVDEILNYIIQTDPNISDEREAAGVLFSKDKISLGLKVEVYNVSTKQTLSSAEEKESALSMLRTYNFGEAHLRDVEKMFQDLPLLIPRVTAGYFEVREHSGSWGIEYQGKRYEWVKNITFDFFQPPGFGYPVTVNNIPAGKNHLFSGYEFLCSGISYPPDTDTFEITDQSSRTVTPTQERSGVYVKFYFLKSDQKPDFYTRVSLDTDKTEPGKKYTGTVTYGLKNTSDQATANTTLIHRVSERDWPITSIPEQITLNPGEEVSFQFAFTGQDKTRSILISEIWPAAGEDPYPADNKAIAQALPVMPVTEPGKSYNPPGSSINLECLDVAYTRNMIPYAPRESKDEASWETTYSWLEDIERGCTPWSYSWTDEDGNSHTESGCDPWENEIWRSETVTYSELLEMKVEVDSWQATEGKGRGVWEIVPLFGPEAHRTVRAGTGFEVNVTTRYATNWETKVPVTADYYGNPVAFGGTYTGPERVFVCFPYANYVKSVAPNNNKDYIVGNKGMGYGELVELEKVEVVKQTDQETIIKWQLPEHSYTGESGRTYSARTHIIDKFWPDAYPDDYDWDITFYKHSNKARVEPKIKFDDRYRFYVVAEMAGKNGLYVIHEDYVYIFGSFFDDVYPTKDPFKDFDDFEW